MSDLIERQAVLNLFPTHDWKHLYDAVKNLPSAELATNLQQTCNQLATDCISRQAVLKAINNMHKESESVLVYAALRNIEEIVKDLPSAQPVAKDIYVPINDIISRQAAIEAIKTSCFLVDAMEKVIKLPSAQPTEASCWGCNCQKMERLKEQKTFSEMVHLHDAETHEERTKTHACDLIDRREAIDFIDAGHLCNPNEPRWSDNEIVNFLKSRPSAQPELPEWAQKVEEYRKSAPSFVRNQLVWALYQTWKEYDGRLVHQRGKENRCLNTSSRKQSTS